MGGVRGEREHQYRRQKPRRGEGQAQPSFGIAGRHRFSLRGASATVHPH
jgi:hypothetical protein